MVNLTNINVYSQSNWQDISATSDSDLNFVEAHVVVETYKNGNSWYRIWDDGWIEQGGIASIESDALFTVTYNKPFTVSNPTVLCVPYNQPTNATTDSNYVCMILNVGTTTFQIRYYDTDASSWRRGTCSWYACGY